MTTDNDDRYGVGLAMPFGFASDDLRIARGTRLLEGDLTLAIGVRRGELPYAMREGGRLAEIKHSKVPRSGRTALAAHLMVEALRQDPRIIVGDTVVTNDGGSVSISTAYRERRYSGTEGQGRIDYEVPA